MQEKIKQPIYYICISAVLTALGTALSMVKIWQMPLGGSVTLLSMLPICAISVIYGVKRAVLPTFVYGAIQIFLGSVFSWGLTPSILMGCIVFDYLLAFTVLSVAGIFRTKGVVGIAFGVALACFLRFICHTVSGVILWTNFEQFSVFGANFNARPILYSVCYNGFFMLPELVFTTAAALLIFGNRAVRKTFLIK